MSIVNIGPIVGLGFGIDSKLEEWPMDYTTLEAVKRNLYRFDLDLHGRDGDVDAQLKDAMISVKGLVDGHLHQSFDKIRWSEWHSGMAQMEITLRYSPLIEVEQVRAYNVDYQTFTVYSGSEMVVNNRIGKISFPTIFIASNPYKAMGAALSGYAFFPGNRNIQIIYTTGPLFNEMPRDFQEYVAQWTAGWLLRNASWRISDGVRSRVIAGVKEDNGYWEQAGDKLIEEAKIGLMKYRRTMAF